MIAHGKMKHSAFSGGHRSKLIWLTGLAHTFGGNFRSQLQLLRPQALEVVAIEAELVVLFRFQSQHLQRNMLERAQELAIAFKQKGTIRTHKFDDDLWALSEFGIYRRIGADSVLQAKSSQLDGVPEDFVNASGSGNSILNRHGWRGGHLCELLNNISNIVPLAAPTIPGHTAKLF